MMTELYMVEPWERLTIHLLMLAIFMGLWVVNYSIVSAFSPALNTPS